MNYFTILKLIYLLFQRGKHGAVYNHPLHSKTRYYVNAPMLVDYYFKQEVALHELALISRFLIKTTQHLIIIFIKQ